MSTEDKHEFQEESDQAGSYGRRHLPLSLKLGRAEMRILGREDRGRSQMVAMVETATPGVGGQRGQRHEEGTLHSVCGQP